MTDYTIVDGKAGDHPGISCFFVPVDAPGF
jgi:alkylation response protein AidB-like acyl-CoA dehydrogenase